MLEKDVMQLLQHQRHDILNHLQIIHGYLSMGNTERVKDKVATWMNYLDEERKLFHLQAPLFALWLMRFNNLHTNFRLTYHIDIQEELQAMDRQLVDQCKQIMTLMKEEADQFSLYELNLEVNEDTKLNTVNIRIIVDGLFLDTEDLKNRLTNMNGTFPIYVKEIENGMVCAFSLSCNE